MNRPSVNEITSDQLDALYDQLDRVRRLIDENPVAVGTHLLEEALDAGHDAGSTVRECATDDRRWPLEKAGEG